MKKHDPRPPKPWSSLKFQYQLDTCLPVFQQIGSTKRLLYFEVNELQAVHNPKCLLILRKSRSLEKQIPGVLPKKQFFAFCHHSYAHYILTYYPTAKEIS